MPAPVGSLRRVLVRAGMVERLALHANTALSAAAAATDALQSLSLSAGAVAAARRSALTMHDPQQPAAPGAAPRLITALNTLAGHAPLDPGHAAAGTWPPAGHAASGLALGHGHDGAGALAAMLSATGVPPRLIEEEADADAEAIDGVPHVPSLAWGEEPDPSVGGVGRRQRQRAAAAQQCLLGFGHAARWRALREALAEQEAAAREHLSELRREEVEAAAQARALRLKADKVRASGMRACPG